MVPNECACCGRPAAASSGERRRRDGATLIIPYCSDCHQHAGAVRTRVLALLLATALLTVTTVLAVPLVSPWSTAMHYAVAILLAAACPIALGLLLRPGPAASPHAPGRAVWWRRDGLLACTNADWAGRLAELNNTTLRREQTRERLWSPWMVASAVAGLVAAPFVLATLRPEVRVLNLTDTPFEVRADGIHLGFVEPSSSESAAAGIDVRIPAGRRTLQVLTPRGETIYERSVDVQAGQNHLFAPSSPNYCFWLETTTYGRSRDRAPRVEPLGGAQRFWVLPGHVETWFAANPPAASMDLGATGGVLTALRQARCSEVQRSRASD